METKIIVVDSGWVLVGLYKKHTEGVRLENAHCIRIWGTDRGLGQLVTGPRKDTKLDPVGIVEIPLHAIKFTIDCDGARWKL